MRWALGQRVADYDLAHMPVFSRLRLSVVGLLVVEAIRYDVFKDDLSGQYYASQQGDTRLRLMRVYKEDE